MLLEKSQVKRYLNFIRHINTRIKTRTRELEALREDISTLGATDYSKDVVQCSKKSDIGDGVVRLLEAEAKVRCERDILFDIRERVRLILHNITNAYAEDVMVSRYIDCLEWHEITDVSGYSRRSVTDLHNVGLEFISKSEPLYYELETIYKDCHNLP